MIEFDPEEVIMNNAVVPFDSSSRPDLHVAVILDGTTLARGTITLHNNTKYKVTLVNPGDALPDVQYALETSEGASFVGGGCDSNKRTHGRLSDSTGHELILESLEKEIRVVAAWAGGHEAVQLTDALVFVPASGNDKKDDEVVEKKQEQEQKKEEVIGVQVVEKHGPHDVKDEKVQETNVTVERKEKEKAAAEKTNDQQQQVNAAEEAHKEDLDAEIQVLKDEVRDLGKNHEDIQGKVSSHETIKRATQHYKDRQEKHQNSPNANDTNHQDRIQRFKDDYKQKHGDKQGDTDKHQETIKRFKDAYAANHADQVKAAKEKIQRKVEDSSQHQETIKRFKDEFRKKHGIPDKKILHEGEARGEVLKRMHDAMYKRGDNEEVTRRQPPQSFVERVKRRYLRQEESPVTMRNYSYGLLFFVVANISILQLCIWIGKRRDKGRRHE